MSVDAERLTMIRANAALVIKEFGELSGTAFGYDESSVAWVEGYIERLRKQHGESAPDGLVSVIGSYLGEAIIAKAGGQWMEDDAGRLGIRFANGDTAYPFTKVQKPLDNGLEAGDSIASFYETSVNFIATGKLRGRTP
jgi:hypothetical protein